MSHRNLTLLITIGLAIVFLPACSEDGDPSGPVDNPTVPLDGSQGSYLVASLHASPWSSLSSMTLDGQGGVSYQRILDSSGDTQESGAGEYEMADDGQFTIEGTIRGIVDQESGLFAMNEPYPGASANLDVGIMRGTGLGNGTLSGSYRGVGLEFWNDQGWESSAYVLRLVADGQGTATVYEERSAGSLDDPIELSYQVAANGQVSFVGQQEVLGAVSPDGDIVLLSVLDGSQNVAMYVMLRVGAGMSNLRLAGDYAYLSIEGASRECEYGLVTFDGAGALTYTMLNHTSDPVPDSGIGTYAVQADGRLLADGEDHGCVSNDGRLAVIGDIDATPRLTLVVKR